MTTWADLTRLEQAELVQCALSENFQYRVNRLTWDLGTKSFPYAHLRQLGLLREVSRDDVNVTGTITPAAIDLLLAAPDDPSGKRFFPLKIYMADMKDKLRKQAGV